MKLILFATKYHSYAISAVLFHSFIFVRGHRKNRMALCVINLYT